MALNQFCGCFAMLNFTATIFKESGSTLSPNVSSILVGGIQIVGAVLCTSLVEKTGRKSLLSVSSFGVSFGLAVLSLYTFSTSRGVDLSSFSWIPLAAFSFVIFISNLGVLTLPFLYVSEVVPTKIKGFTMILCLVLLYIFATIVIQVRKLATVLKAKFNFLSLSIYRLLSTYLECTEPCCCSRLTPSSVESSLCAFYRKRKAKATKRFRNSWDEKQENFLLMLVNPSAVNCFS